MSGHLTVRGGTGGVRANLTDQRRWAGLLDEAGDVLRRAAHRASDADDLALLLRTAVWSPTTAASSGLQLVDGVARVVGLAVRTEVQADVLRTTAALTEAADAWPTAVAERLQRELGALGTAVVVGGALAELVQPASVAAILVAAAAPDQTVLGAAAARLDQLGSELVTGAPWIVDMTVNGLTELTDDALTAGRPVDTLDNTEAAGLLVSVLSLGRVMRDTAVTLRPYDGAATVPPAPTDARELVDHLGDLMEATRHVDDSSLLGLTEVVRADSGSAWIVQVPGTQTMALGGADPADMATNLGLMADADVALLVAVREMLTAAGAAPGDPIMTVGHSQGGMAATRLAAQLTATGLTVTHTLTLGSPVAEMPVPTTVLALSLEHQQDLVPRLDGHRNPDELHRTTITADAPDGFTDTTIGPHALAGYAVTLDEVLASDHPSVTAWTSGTDEVYFTGEGTTAWTTVSREP